MLGEGCEFLAFLILSLLILIRKEEEAEGQGGPVPCWLKCGCIELGAGMESRLMLRFDQFTREKVLGTGSFGKVWLGRYNDAEVAVKELNPYATQTKYIVSEMETLAQLSHPNIITLYGLCIVDEGIFILTEYAAKGDLRKKLDSSHVVFSLKLKVSLRNFSRKQVQLTIIFHSVRS